MRAQFSIGALLAVLALVASMAGAAAPSEPDLTVVILVEPVDASLNLTARVPARVVVIISNVGGALSPPTEVDLWCKDCDWPGQTLPVGALGPGNSTTLAGEAPYTPSLASSVTFFALVDPADRVPETIRANNAANVTAEFGVPAPTVLFLNVEARLAGERELAPYSMVCFVLRVSEGQSVLFQAEAVNGSPFDQYLLDEAGWQDYRAVQPGGGANGSSAHVSYFKDYSFPNTTHVAFTTAPLPAGTYFIVLENDARLERGADPTGSVNVSFAVAQVNTSLPVAAIAIILGAAAAAVWATVKWRPAFDIRSPLLGVGPPDPAELDDDEEEDGQEEDSPDLKKRSTAPRPPRVKTP